MYKNHPFTLEKTSRGQYMAVQVSDSIVVSGMIMPNGDVAVYVHTKTDDLAECECEHFDTTRCILTYNHALDNHATLTYLPNRDLQALANVLFEMGQE